MAALLFGIFALGAIAIPQRQLDEQILALTKLWCVRLSLYSIMTHSDTFPGPCFKNEDSKKVFVKLVVTMCGLTKSDFPSSENAHQNFDPI